MYKFVVVSETKLQEFKDNSDTIIINERDYLNKVFENLENASFHALPLSFYEFLGKVHIAIETCNDLKATDKDFLVVLLEHSKMYTELVDNIISTVCFYNEIPYSITHNV
ncbi:MAG: hypothetical protein ACI37Z_03500 [Candidatus Gastranaerophilaceae bacterium]